MAGDVWEKPITCFDDLIGILLPGAIIKYVSQQVYANVADCFIN